MDLVRPVIRGGSELLEVDDPMDVEGWASQVLGVWFKMPLPPFERIEFEKQIRPAMELFLVDWLVRKAMLDRARSVP